MCSTCFPALIPLKSRKAGFMSGGEQQMLAVGMALVAPSHTPFAWTNRSSD